MNVVLTGFMGVGKSTIGKLLSEKLGFGFCDTDKEIEKNSNMSIPEIFEKYGETKFREIETKVIKEISLKQNCVISCGGGVVKSDENMNYLKTKGKIINLYATVEKILSNIGDDQGRPLIKGKSKQEIKQLMEEREQFYKNADLRIDVTYLTKEEIVNQIEDFIRNGEKYD